MWKDSLANITNGGCVGCSICDGSGCRGQLPGWGGINGGRVFMANYASWEAEELPRGAENAELPQIALAPITGAVQNIGLLSEREFYFTLIESACEAGVGLCIGDGAPDDKLRYGVEALSAYKKKGAVFIKPYINEIFAHRIERAAPVAEIIGVDVDSWRIDTMKDETRMEKKDAAKLLQIRALIPDHIPFAIKGVCDDESVRLIQEVKPDIAVVSNHGGRVRASETGTAVLLRRYAPSLAPYVAEIWVDGGVRTKEHLRKAAAFGAKRALIGRPFVQGAIALGKAGVSTVLREEFGL